MRPVVTMATAPNKKGEPFEVKPGVEDECIHYSIKIGPNVKWEHGLCQSMGALKVYSDFMDLFLCSQGRHQQLAVVLSCDTEAHKDQYKSSSEWRNW